MEERVKAKFLVYWLKVKFKALSWQEKTNARVKMHLNSHHTILKGQKKGAQAFECI